MLAWRKERPLVKGNEVLGTRVLRYRFEPRSNIRARATAGSVMTFGLSISGCSHSIKPVWLEKTRLTSPDVWATVASNVKRDSGRDSFSSFSLKKRKGRSAWKNKQRNTALYLKKLKDRWHFPCLFVHQFSSLVFFLFFLCRLVD